MTLKEYFSKPYKIKYYQLKSIIIVTMLTTLLSVNIWDRLRSDALSFGWLWYIVLIIIFSIPLFINKEYNELNLEKELNSRKKEIK